MNLKLENKMTLEENNKLNQQMNDQKARSDDIIAQLRAKLAQPRNQKSFSSPTFASPRKSSSGRSVVSNNNVMQFAHIPDNIFEGRIIRQSPPKYQVAPEYFVPTYPSRLNGDSSERSNVELSKPFLDPTFSDIMKRGNLLNSSPASIKFEQSLRDHSLPISNLSQPTIAPPYESSFLESDVDVGEEAIYHLDLTADN